MGRRVEICCAGSTRAAWYREDSVPRSTRWAPSVRRRRARVIAASVLVTTLSRYQESELRFTTPMRWGFSVERKV